MTYEMPAVQKEDNKPNRTTAWGQHAAMNMRSMISRVQPESILDIGGNDGFAALQMRDLDLHRNVSVIDGDQACIDYARSEGVKAYQGDLCNMPFEDGQFDWGFCSHTLEHLEDMDRALAEIQRVCRTGCFVVVPCEDEVEVKKTKAHVRNLNHEQWLAQLGAVEVARTDVELTCVIWYAEPTADLPDTYIVDFDDLCDEFDPYDDLMRLKLRWPGLKVTMFAIPGRCSEKLLSKWGALEWVELGIHGYHHSSYECGIWDYEEAKAKIQECLDLGYAPVFKAPGWILNHDVVRAANDLDCAIAEHGGYGPSWVGANPKRVYVHNDYENPRIAIHGHTWDTMGNGPSRWDKMFSGVPKDAKFAFVSEAADQTFDGIEIVLGDDDEVNESLRAIAGELGVPAIDAELAGWRARHIFAQYNRIKADGTLRPGDVVLFHARDPKDPKQLMAAAHLADLGVTLWAPTHEVADAFDGLSMEVESPRSQRAAARLLQMLGGKI